MPAERVELSSPLYEGGVLTVEPRRLKTILFYLILYVFSIVATLYIL